MIASRPLGSGGRPLLIILLTCFMFVGCNKKVTQPNSLDVMYPLGIGTLWEYTAGRSDSVAARVTLDGKEYTQISGTLFPHSLVRMDSGRLLVRKSETSALESVLFDFTADAGESWEYAVGTDVPAPTVTLISKTDVVTVPAGTYTDCYTFFFDISDDAVLDMTYVVAPEVGAIRILEHSGVSYDLTDYVPAN